MKESQEGWIILEWNKEIEYTSNLFRKLPKSANGVRGINGKHWEDLYKGDDFIKADVDLKSYYPGGIAIKVDDLLSIFNN